MHDNRPPKGDLALAEFATYQQCFQTLVDRASASGAPALASFLVRDNLMGVLVIGPDDAMVMMSRILRTVGSSPLVKMPEGQ